MKEKVLKALEKIRPHLQADGGDVELVEITPESLHNKAIQSWK